MISPSQAAEQFGFDEEELKLALAEWETETGRTVRRQLVGHSPTWPIFLYEEEDIRDMVVRRAAKLLGAP